MNYIMIFACLISLSILFIKIKYKFNFVISDSIEFSFSIFLYKYIFFSLIKFQNNIKFRFKIFNLVVKFNNIKVINNFFDNKLDDFESIFYNFNCMLKNIVCLRCQLKFINKFLRRMKTDKVSFIISIFSEDLFILGFYFGLGNIISHNIENSKVSINSKNNGVNKRFNIFVKGNKMFFIFILYLLVGFVEYNFYKVFFYNFKLRKSTFKY